MRALLTIPVILLAGCTAVTGRNDPPDVDFISQKPLNAAVACVVTHMSAAYSRDVAFLARIAVPDQIYEVHPTSEIMFGGEPMFVRVEKAGEKSRISGYVTFGGRRFLSGLETACA